jgi:beta-lactamase superfamily II metal-dependent hydrolase
MKLTLLPSDKGDCMLLESADGTAILIDGGMSDSYKRYVREFLAGWRKKHDRPLDLVYLSHIDQDHIAGVLQLMNDLVDWRVYRFKTQTGETWEEPGFGEPPEVKRLWHNGFHDLAKDNAGPIGAMLAARAAMLTNNLDSQLRKLASSYAAIANSIPESIKLSSRVSAKQLKIPLNQEFGGLLAMVRDEPEKIQLNGVASPSITVIGPFEEDLKALRTKWNKWLSEQNNKANLTRTRAWRDTEDERLSASSAALDIDDELGDRKKVTEENLASLMLVIEYAGKRILLTGDGHAEDIIRGLKHIGLLTENKGLHVAVLKVQHHGSEHNLDRAFARLITADHYVICGNGLHDNPDLAVLEVIAASRIGHGEELSENPEAGQPFEVWFNCSTDFLQAELEWRESAKLGTTLYTKAAQHFADIERDMKKYQEKSGGRLNVHYLNDEPLELTL